MSFLNPAVEPDEGPVETSAEAKPEGIGLGLEFVFFLTSGRIRKSSIFILCRFSHAFWYVGGQ